MLAFAGSLVSESAAAAYSLLHLSGVQVPATGESVYCKSGFVQSGDVVNATREVDREQDGPSGRDTKSLLTNNCHSSLQLLAADTPALQIPVSQTLLSSSVRLLSSQLFVHQIADPPRLG